MTPSEGFETKTCTRCKRSRPIAEYANGRASCERCCQLRRLYQKQWLKDNPEERAIHVRMRYDRVRYGGKRFIILERDGYQCVRCGMSDKEHYKQFGTLLTINHIDGNGWNSKTPNNNPSNLETLCFRCHTRIDNLRLKRYAQMIATPISSAKRREWGLMGAISKWKK